MREWHRLHRPLQDSGVNGGACLEAVLLARHLRTLRAAVRGDTTGDVEDRGY